MASNSSDSGARGRKFDGLKSVAELLNFMNPDERNRMLANLAKTDPTLTEKIKGKMYGFEDLFQLEAEKLRILLARIPVDKLKLALRAASEEWLENHVFVHMSQRAASHLKEELAEQGPQRQSKVTAAQVEIVELAREILKQS